MLFNLCRMTASELRVRAGISASHKAVVYTGQDIRVHPSFKRTSLINNLALIKVQETIAPSRFIQFVCLPIGQRSRDSMGKQSFKLLTLCANESLNRNFLQEGH